MTTHPGAAEERPAEAGPVDLFGCSCAVSAVIKNVASAKERATISDSLMDERMEFLDDFDLLMENASHSNESMGIRICAAGGGQLLWPRTEAKKARFNPGQGFLAFGPLVVARVRTE